MTRIWIVALEPIDQRYTKQWFEDIPNMIAADIKDNNLDWKVATIVGKDVPDQTTDGAFLDFGATNYYKGTQVASISSLFSNGEIKKGDKFLVTDAWNFNITAIKYMSELFDIKVEIHGIWHAGAYDPTDILGMKMSNEWSAAQEQAWFYACDYNYFGTEFHRDMFLNNLNIPKQYHNKAIRSGQPYNHVAQLCFNEFDNTTRPDNIVFTHRLNEDKQPDIFRNLIEVLPNNYTYVITQELSLSKNTYYKVLSESKIAFSCSLHENLGIGQMESVLHGCIPLVPDRASYSEIYLDIFKYPSEWTKDYDHYLKHKDDLLIKISELMNNYDKIHDNELKEQGTIIVDNYMSSTIMNKQLLTPMK